MKKNIFEYSYYKPYVREWLMVQPKRGRGLKSAMAKALGCQTAYVSQVLSGEQEFSLEQADRLNEFLNHDSDEARFFLLLVQKDRAGTPSLRKHFKAEISDYLKDRNLTLERMDDYSEISEEDRSTYFGSWTYPAAHMLLNVPTYRNVRKIAERLGISERIAKEVLNFLVSAGLARKVRDQYTIHEKRIYLENKWPLVGRWHMSWRLQSLRSIEKAKTDDYFFSSVFTVAESEMPEFNRMLRDFIEKFDQKTRASKDETLRCLTVDFFAL